MKKYLGILVAVVSLLYAVASAQAAIAGFVIDEAGYVSVIEGGTAPDSYTVALAAVPTANVTVAISASISQLLVSPTTLTFTSENWSKPQTISVEAFDDVLYEQAHASLITHTATSTDTQYDAKTATVSVQITDNDQSGSTGGRDTQAPDAPTNITLSTDGKKVTITWKDPVMPDFRKMEVMRNAGGTTPVDAGNAMPIVKGEQIYVDTNVTAGQTYLYQLRAQDWSANTRLTPEFSIKVEAPVVVPAPAPTPAPTPAPQPEPVKVPTEITTSPGFGTPELAAQEVLAAADAQAFGVSLSSSQANILGYFYLNGLVPGNDGKIPAYATKLGAGERRAIIRDYFETVGRADVLWADIERMAGGVKPVGRNLAKEQAQAAAALGMWLKVKGRAPNFKNTSEDLAWNTLMYRIRFTRDLTKEAGGITKFRAVFQRIPVSPMDWAMVRALGYVL